MSTFPGSNLNVISGIDPVGAGFLGGEVSRLQSDTENKRNNQTARRGQDQEVMLTQQQMAQQAQQQQAQMQQQQEQFDRDQEATATENTLTRSFQTDILSFQTEQEDNRRAYDIAVRTGDLEAAKAVKDRMVEVGRKLRGSEKKVSAYQILNTFHKSLSDPNGENQVKAINSALEAMSQNNAIEFDYAKSLDDAVQQGYADTDAEESNRSKVLGGLRSGEGEGLAERGAMVNPIGAGLAALAKEIGLGKQVGALEAKLGGWVDNMVPGNLIQEATPEQKVEKTAVNIAKRLAERVNVDGVGKSTMEAKLILYLKAGTAAAASPDEGREKALGIVKEQAAELRKIGVTDKMLKTIIGAVGTVAQGRRDSLASEAAKMEGAEDDSRRYRINELFQRTADQLESASGVTVDRSSYVVGKDGKVRYMGADLPMAQLQTTFIDLLDGALSDENRSVFTKMGPKGEQLLKLVEGQARQYLEQQVKLAQDNGLSLDEVLIQQEGPSFLPKFKNVAQMLGVALEEQGALADEQDDIKLGEMTTQGEYVKKQEKLRQEANKRSLERLNNVRIAAERRDRDREKGLR